MLAKNFMKGHTRFGDPTNFKQKFLAGEKIHTIRQGDYWKLIVHRVNNGSAVLSIREWSGKAYRSKQVEIAKLTKLGWQKFEFKYSGDCMTPFIDDKPVNVDDFCDVCENDGLQKHDFLRWFNYPKAFEGGIIHFTDFKY